MTAVDPGVRAGAPIPINGSVNLHVLRTDKFKTAVCCLLVRRPLTRGESAKNAVLAAILRQGCAKYPSIARMYGRMEELYGGVFDCQIVKKGEEQILQLYFESVPNDGAVAKGIEFLAEVLLNPLAEGGSFKREVVRSAKNSVKNAVEGRINNKAEYARVKCIEHVCEGEPFGIYADGYAEDLDGLDGENLYLHYKDILKTSPIELICAGALDEDELVPAARRIYIPDRQPAGCAAAITKPARPEVQYITEDQNSSQSKICMGLRSAASPASRQFYGLLMMNEILGGGPNSKLFMKIREEQNLCYYINSVLYRFKSLIIIQTGVAGGRLERIVNAVNREIEDIRQGCVTREEWDSARQGLATKFKGGLDHFSAVLDFYTQQYLLNENKSVPDMIESIEAVTLDETAKAARSMSLDTVYELI